MLKPTYTFYGSPGISSPSLSEPRGGPAIGVAVMEPDDELATARELTVVLRILPSHTGEPADVDCRCPFVEHAHVWRGEWQCLGGRTRTYVSSIQPFVVVRRCGC